MTTSARTEARAAGDGGAPLVPTPAGNALRFDTLVRSKDLCVMSIPFTPQSGAEGDVIDGGAMLTLADQCMGTAAVGIPPTPALTLDLRVDWLRPARPRAVVFCIARRRSVGPRWMQVEADLVHELDGPPIGRCVGQFLGGTYPGGGALTQIQTPESIVVDWTSFSAFLGLDRDGEAWCLPAADHRVGTLFLPALHGGVMAAAMEAAMRATAGTEAGVRLSSARAEFLRPARGDLDLIITTHWVRKGRTVGVLGCRAVQPGRSETIAVGRAVVIQEDAAHG